MWLKDKLVEAKVFLKNHNYLWKFKLLVCLPIFVVLTSLDWITKAIVVGHMKLGETKTFLSGFLNFHYVINLGMAYGRWNDKAYLVILLATFFSLFLTITFIFLNNKKWLIVLVIILAGSWGNLLARLWAPGNEDNIYYGVVDFLIWDFSLFNSRNYVFNLADLYVNIAIGLTILFTIIELVIFIKSKIKTKRQTEKIENEQNNS
ncbi:signal peptidase II [Mycoplasma feriruminatoris]|uniref:signal peptidase II n=1 Tax=Mycoplasma feriruminatoris TaxID=1179777 RepID=UPI0002A505D9|nr:signal peptidase II [Mycoplasma feriruminatoris]UKS54032.1 signal peptidase (SPase) II family protein [Mycoplasma feriruminatoris]VZR75345.1 Lipoprotein signal peptidase [Mycoplasma feriruminatoris]VZR97531.1 Lipoprotein signal peptidase [Mycoplasma feriruminatoris]VZR97575.1 Lipoprotein signal peptidase [Mycoplasma feriruminatoris]